MSNKDVLKILLCTYGYDRNLKINTYYGDNGSIGYDVYAENKNGDVYSEINSDGLMFHIYNIHNYMKSNNANLETKYWGYNINYVLNDKIRESFISNIDIIESQTQESLTNLKPIFQWRKDNNPCPTCQINKKDHWDSIHYNCELCHTHSCDILSKFDETYHNLLKACKNNSNPNNINNL